MSAWEVVHSTFFDLYPFVAWVLVLLIVNLITGVMVAILPTNPERFKLGALGDWMLQVLIYVGGAGSISLLRVVAPPDYIVYFQATETVAWGSVIVSLLAKILLNLRLILPGGTKIPIPDWMGDKSLPEAQAKP